ncbi:hypothetical protein GCM10011614_10570 [Novosphingobium colocasiae]|uniref:Uncharacterized protein n=1 Tax=Novosphingobium colocasiae TaxID=1256513 RepID=A0A918PB65_9SPHN|nr:hypothetical protein GCM10011614_10570 [Novosphingobium colocasiae]
MLRRPIGSYRPLIAALLILPLGGCERIDMLEVTVRTDQDIAISLPSGRCIDSLEIGGMQMRRTVAWRIERDPALKAPCTTHVVFPQVPPGFKNPYSADKLPEGSYQIAGMAGNYALAGHFDLPAR